MKKILKCGMRMAVMLLVLICIDKIKVYATTTGSFSVSSSSQNLNPGGTATLTISTVNCDGKFKITSSDSNVVSVSKMEIFSADEKSVTITAKSAGTATITVEAEDVGDNQTDPQVVTGSQQISITVTAPASTSTPTPTPADNSSEYSSTNETVYVNTSDVRMRKSAVSGDIITNLSKATQLTRTGVGSNGWSRVVYNGTTGYVRSDFLSTSAPSGSSDSKLKALSVSTGTLSPSFSSGTTSYSMTVDSTVESINISATPNDSKASVRGTGKITLKDGTNQAKITVTAENGTTTTYKINISKMINEGAKPGNLIENQQTLQLTTLNIEGITLSPAFSPEVFSYTATISDEKLNDLKVLEATPNQEGVTVEIIGDKGLVAGENILTIILKSADGVQVVTYQVIINKEGTLAVTEITKVEGETNQFNIKDTIINLPLKSKLIIGGIIFITLVLIILLIVKYVKDKKEEEEEFMFEDLDRKDDDETFDFDKEYTKEDFMKNFGNNDLDFDNDYNKSNSWNNEKLNSFDDNYEVDEGKPYNENTGNEPIIGEDIFKEPEIVSDIEPKVANTEIEDNFDEDIYSKISRNIDEEIGNSGIFGDDVRYGMRKNKRSGGRGKGKGRHF